MGFFKTGFFFFLFIDKLCQLDKNKSVPKKFKR